MQHTIRSTRFEDSLSNQIIYYIIYKNFDQTPTKDSADTYLETLK